MVALEQSSTCHTASALVESFVPCPTDEFIRIGGDAKDQYAFMMGGSSEVESLAWEQPRHRVRQTPFQLMSTPVTQRLFALFHPNHERQGKDERPKFSPEPECPANDMSWYDAWCFARWLGTDDQLPTEAQWEYACRADADGQQADNLFQGR